jgi:hypothetical protein
MTTISRALAAPALAVALLAGMPATSLVGTAHAACEAGDHINGSTAQWAADKAKQAGYTQISMEKKGCDNYWHGLGSKDGQQGRFVVAPDGSVTPERN